MLEADHGWGGGEIFNIHGDLASSHNQFHNSLVRLHCDQY
jgi:hypothetical protein